MSHSETSLRGWKGPRQSHRHCPVCGQPTEVVVAIAARERASDGAGKTLESASLTLCNEHALELYAGISGLLEERRG